MTNKKDTSQGHLRYQPLDAIQIAAITNSIPAFVAYLDCDFRYQFINDSYIKAFGKTREELLGHQISEVFGESVFAQVRPHLEKALTGERVSLSLEIDDAKGGKKNFQGSYTPDFDSKGQVKGLVVLQNDVTDRYRSEQRVLESENRTRKLLDRMPQLIWTTSASGNTVYANEQCLRYTGYDITEKQNDGWTNSLHPQDAPKVYEKWLSSMSTGETFETEYRIRSRTGEYRWFLGRAIAVHNDQGEIIEWFGTATDIDDRKKAEEIQSRFQRKVFQLQTIASSLATAQTPLEIARTIIDEGLKAINADAGSIVLLDQNQNSLQVLYSTGYAQKILDQWQNQSIDAEMPISDAIRNNQPIFLSSKEQIAESYPKLENSQNQVRIESHALAALPLLVEGRALGAIGLSFKEGQEFSKERIGYLTILAEQCAQAIERARLFEAEKRARENAEIASKAKSQFLANMSHEIRTPMNAILGFSDLMSDSSLNESERKDYRRRIRLNGDQLLHLIDDILDLSKIEAGRLDVEKIEFSISEIIRDVHESLSSVVDPKGISLRLLLEDSVPATIQSDPTRLKQILTNLLGNAAKFTSQGSIETRVFVRGSQLVIDVKDTGVGIEPELQKNLFQAFAQGDSSVTRRFGGTGLGLVLSRRIAEALGGSLELIESAPEKGSLFRVVLPLQDVAGSSSEVSLDISTAPLGEAEKGPLQGVRILLAEDSADNEALMRAYLKRTGASLEVARNGQEAFDKALAGDFDIVFMDIQMPILDGVEATQMLRKRDYRVPIVALSAHALSEEINRSLKAGCQAYLTKPVTRAGLLEEIKKILKI